MHKRRVAFHTLGCKVNQYETEKLALRFQELGFEIVADVELADVYIINSCTVTAMADRKSRNYARRSKRMNPKSLTALVGCYAEVAGDQLANMPEIDLLLGSEEKAQLPERVCALLAAQTAGDAESLPDSEMQVGLAPSLESPLGIEAAQVDAESFPVSNMQTVPALPPECPADKEAAQADAVCQPVTNRTRAYLKIEDGCDRRCTYCVIPLARGKVRSRPMETVLTEAKTLIDAGYKEIVLTGINTALYGNDFSHYRNQGDGIVDIVNQLASLSGDFRIRLNSLEPTVVDAACVKTLSACERLCAHFHLSLQSGSDRVLKAMGRPYRMRDYMEIVEALRARDADVAITTDLIIGFPGETRADFEESLKAVRDIGFARIHVFKYSRRPQTAAAEMREQVSEAIKAERSRALIDVGLETAAAFRAQNAGKTRQALFLERGQDDFYTGMTDNDLEIRLQSKKDLTNQLLDITLSAEILRTDMAYREKQAKGAPC